jgi:hypothetical protein
MSNSNNVDEYIKSSESICMYSTLSMVLILLFIVSPINKFFLTSLFGKTIILSLLGYTLYYNTTLTNKFSNQLNIYLLDGTWNPVKTNITCSYLFSFFLFVLFLSVIRTLFF